MGSRRESLAIRGAATTAAQASRLCLPQLPSHAGTGYQRCGQDDSKRSCYFLPGTVCLCGLPCPATHPGENLRTCDKPDRLAEQRFRTVGIPDPAVPTEFRSKTLQWRCEGRLARREVVVDLRGHDVL